MNDSFGNGFDRNHLYRNTEDRVFAGVCSGIADHFGFAVGPTRLIALIACLMTFPLGVIVYIAAAVLLKRKPHKTFDSKEEQVFWQEVRRSPKATFSNVRFRLRQIDQNLQRMERYVTSSRFKLDRDFRNLESDGGAPAGPTGNERA